MKNYILPIIFILFPTIFFSQSISSALHINEPYKINQKKAIKKIETKTVFYNRQNQEKRKEITYLNDRFRLIKEERYNEDGEMIFSMQNEYLSDTLKVKSTTVRTIPLIGNEIVHTTYEYDVQSFLTKIIKRSQNNTIFETVHLQNDDRGNPILLYLNNGELGYEKASYDYVNNTYSTYYYRANDELITSDLSSPLDFNEPIEGYRYNEFGDVVETPLYLMEYHYDDFGNWTREKRYQKVGNQKILKAEVSRKIKYQ